MSDLPIGSAFFLLFRPRLPTVPPFPKGAWPARSHRGFPGLGGDSGRSKLSSALVSTRNSQLFGPHLAVSDSSMFTSNFSRPVFLTVSRSGPKRIASPSQAMAGKDNRSHKFLFLPWTRIAFSGSTPAQRSVDGRFLAACFAKADPRAARLAKSRNFQTSR